MLHLQAAGLDVELPDDSRQLRNQFNFSERAAQTFSYPMRDRATFTEPAPTATIAGVCATMIIVPNIGYAGHIQATCGLKTGFWVCSEVNHAASHQCLQWKPAPAYLGVFVTREHVRHNKSGITHRGKTRISH
jgi:hypothetical protein